MSLHDARKELRYLLNKGYRKKTALEFVSNHNGLSRDDRNILARTTYSDDECANTSSKAVPFRSLRGAVMAIDGYNVLNTVESVLYDDPLVCDDGVIRDDLKRGGSYVISSRTDAVLDALDDFFSKARPEKVIFFLDKDVPHSGDHAAYIRAHHWKVPVESQTAQAVDHELKSAEGVIVATADSGIISYLESFFDIPRHLLFSW